MAIKNQVPEFSLRAKEISEQRPRIVAIEAAKFFKECFVKEGWTDSSFQAWAKRSSPLGGNKILIGGAGANSMNLMQSIHTLEQNEKTVRTGSTLVYANTHNEGASITVTAKMKKWWWIKYAKIAGIKLGDRTKGEKTNWKKTNNLLKTKKGTQSNSIANKATNAKAEYCKRMALMKVGTKIKIPKRKFIGESKTLLTQFEEWFADEINKLK